jgi:AcrR family transcriptional regulator
LSGPTLTGIGGTSSNAATYARLLDAAERQFAARGYSSTSIRDLTREAGCNVACVSYYFGGKDRLYRQVFLRRLPDVAAALDAVNRPMARAGAAPSVEETLEAFIDGLLGLLAGGVRNWSLARLVVRELVDPHLPPDVLQASVLEPARDMVVEALCRAVPGLTTQDARRAVRSVVAQAVYELNLLSRMPPADPIDWPATLTARARHIVRFSAGGIRACARAALSEHLEGEPPVVASR